MAIKQITDTEISCILSVLESYFDRGEGPTKFDIEEAIEILESLQNYEQQDDE